jgi:heavy metal sensor kinase
MAVLFITLPALGLLLYATLDKIVYHAIDSGLLSKAKALATLIYEDKDETEFNFSDDIMWEYNSPKARTFFQIRRPNGSIIEKSESLGKAELLFQPGDKGTTFKTITLKSSPARLINFYIHNKVENTSAKAGETKKQGLNLILQCAQDIDAQTDLLQNYGIALFLSIFVVMAISAAGGFVIARRALEPVEKMSKTVDKISEANLSERIDIEDTPKELRVLASSFNTTFDRLSEAFKRQKQFTADASHELRTPLAVILSQSEITIRKERSVSEYKDALTAVMDAAKIMSAMVSKLLFLARLTTGKMDVDKEPIALDKIIAETVRLLTPIASQKNTRINIVPTGDHLLVFGDRAALLQLYINIIDNAIKYGAAQGAVDISVKKEDGFIVSEIKDHGIGITKENLGRIFDRFYRVDKSRSRESGGIGLGMSICQAIVRQHNGKIEIGSEVGIGTIVSIYLKEAG